MAHFGGQPGCTGGILFLAIEVQQNTQMMRSQTRTQVSQATIANVNMYREPALVSAMMSFMAGNALTEEEIYVLGNAANVTFRMWGNNFYQYQEGLYDESEFEADIAVWQDIITNNSIYREFWTKERALYSSQFRIFVDDVAGEISQ